MKQVITSFLFAILMGVAAAAFFRPAVPYQVEVESFKPNLFLQTKSYGIDAGLDNPNIAPDQNISPSRKCGFCMG